MSWPQTDPHLNNHDYFYDYLQAFFLQKSLQQSSYWRGYSVKNIKQFFRSSRQRRAKFSYLCA